jgi:hypothetical protein
MTSKWADWSNTKQIFAQNEIRNEILYEAR